MAFRRHIRDRKPTCGIYGCEQPATRGCTVCKRTMCQDCVKGHATQHAKQSLAGVH